MEIFLFLFVVATIIALAYLKGQIGDLRADISELREREDNRDRAFDGRLAQLERASAERRIDAAPATKATAEPAPVPIKPMPPPPIQDQAQPSPHPYPSERERQATAPALSRMLPPTPPHFTNAPASYSPPFSETIPRPRTDHPPEPPNPPATPQTPQHVEVLSLEERLGANWLPKLGISILVIGIAFFLAPRLINMGPVGKALTGLAVSLALLIGGIFLERKQRYQVFARTGIGGGWALLFFTTFAMHHFAAIRVISSLPLDLVLMLLVAAGMVLHSLRYRSQTITGLAFLLGFATLATSDLEATSGTVVFSLLASAVLALGLVVVTTLRQWAWLEFAGLVAVMANHFLWLALVIPGSGGIAHFPLFWQSTALILFYWIIFRAAYLLRIPLNPEEDRISSLSAVVTAGGVLGLLKLQSAHPEWAFRALLAMGTVEMLLGVWSRHRRRSAFIVLTTIASVLLVAAVPFQFHGVSWPVLWLVEAHALALCGLRLNEPVFRRLGLLAGFSASLVLLFHDVLPLLSLRLADPDPSHHPSLTIGLALAAALFWLHGEVYPRRWPEIASAFGELEHLALTVTSWLGLAAAAAALWVVLPAHWVAVGWMALVILLGLLADRQSVVNLALQADALAVLSIPALFIWDFASDSHEIHKLPSALAIALYYAAMRRRTVLPNSAAYVAPAYSWIASLLLMVWTSQAIANEWLILTWAACAFALFETGQYCKRGFLRWQSFVSAALALIWLQGRWFDESNLYPPRHGWLHISALHLSSMIATAALLYWLQERTRKTTALTRSERSERVIGILAGFSATWVLAFWLPLLIPIWRSPQSASPVWAILASSLLTVALLTKRGSFQIHAILVALWTGLCGAFLAFQPGPAETTLPWAAGFVHTTIFRHGLASAIFLSALPIAFRLRHLWTAADKWSFLPEPTANAIARPEQWFFFIPFGLMIVTLAAKLSEGNITLGWSLLGLGTFIFALLVGQRSYRLGGLALLLLCVVKILLMDVWRMNPTDKYTTLIATGCALMLVSFFYARFREVIRKYL